jgi:antitoxin MazE
VAVERACVGGWFTGRSASLRHSPRAVQPAGPFDGGRDGNYNVLMRIKLVPIGNSKCVRLPKAVLEQCSLRDEIELEVRGEQVILRSPQSARAGWDAAFARMARRGDDALLDEAAVHSPTAWEREEWRW